jgi:hypothetical protein
MRDECVRLGYFLFHHPDFHGARNGTEDGIIRALSIEQNSFSPIDADAHASRLSPSPNPDWEKGREAPDEGWRA